MSKQLNPLTPDEKYVIQGKGTERPFMGEYTDTTAAGLYIWAGALEFCVWSGTVTWGIFLSERVLPRRIFVTVLTLFP